MNKTMSHTSMPHIMTRLTLATLAACATIISIPETAFAGSDDVVVESPWARAVIGTTRPGAAYLIVRNIGTEAVTLRGIATPLAMMAEIHQSTVSADGVSLMARAGQIEIAPGDSAALEPGGLHAMLMMLQGPMVVGETFPLTLTFDDGSEIVVEVPILGVAARGPDG